MTFNNIVFKNFVFNIKRYLTYFSCISFSVMIFFTFLTLMYNKDFEQICKSSKTIESIMLLSLIIVAIFAIFFISYSHTYFLKSRYKEFGLYFTMGMTKKDLTKMMLIENMAIDLLSLFLGFILGTIFSKPFFLAISGLSKISNIKFSLSFSSYVVTFSVFIIIFLLVLITGIISIRRLQISEILKQDRKVETLLIYHPLFGFAGIILISISIVLLYLFHNSQRLQAILVISLLLCIIGLYLITSHFGNLLIKLIKKKRGMYYKNLLSINEISSKFNQNKRNFFATSILVAAIVFVTGISYSADKTTLYYSQLWNPHNISFAQILDINQISNEDLKAILDRSETPVTYNKALEFILFTRNNSAVEFDRSEKRTVVISENQYNSIFNQNINIVKNSAAFINLSGSYMPESIEVKTSKSTFDFTEQTELDDPFYSTNSQAFSFTDYIIIVNNEDYSAIKKEMPEKYIGAYHMIDFKDWKKSQSTFLSLINNFNEKNPKLKPYNEGMFPLNSLLGTLSMMQMENSFMFFVFSFIGALFFIASSIMLYLKMHMYIDDTIRRYQKIYRIGLNKRELKFKLFKELPVYFFLPLFLGSVLGYMYLFTTFNIGGFSKMYIPSLIIFPIYFVIQGIYYLSSSFIYSRKVAYKACRGYFSK